MDKLWKGARDFGVFLSSVVYRQGGGFTVGVGLTMVLIITLSKGWQVIGDVTSELEPVTEWVHLSEVIRNIGLVAVAIVGVFFAVWRSIIASQNSKTASRQVFLVEQGQVTDRLTEAMKTLCSKNTLERVGAIHALARIAGDSIERDHITVMKFLCDFINHFTYSKELKREIYVGYKSTSVDLIAAINAISTRNYDQLQHEKNNNYRPTIEGAVFESEYFNSIVFRNINIYNTKFIGCNFKYINFAKSVILNLTFNNANIENINFRRTGSDGLSFVRCNVHITEISNSKWRKTVFKGFESLIFHVTGGTIHSLEFCKSKIALVTFRQCYLNYICSTETKISRCKMIECSEENSEEFVNEFKVH